MILIPDKTALLIGGFVLAISLSTCGTPDPAFAEPKNPIVRMVLQEAANEPFEGKVAVAGVALDRMQDDRWPKTAKAVIMQPSQFTGMTIPFRRYTEVQIAVARNAVEVAEAGYRPCGRVLHYHTTDVDPKWNRDMILACQIGEHLFYSDGPSE